MCFNSLRTWCNSTIRLRTLPGEWAREALAKRLPEFAERRRVGRITGSFTLTPDALPIIGPAPGIGGLYVATGFAEHGFNLAPAVGEGVSQMLAADKVSAFDPEAFSLSRFTGRDQESTSVMRTP